MNLKKFFRLYFQMLRYRVAIMLPLFFLLGIAINKNITYFSIKYLLAIIALFSNYVAATTINDIADEKIDKVNHQNSQGRPLVKGEATKKDLYFLHFLSILIALISAIFINLNVFLIILISILISYSYSMPPLRLSYKTHLVALVLSIAYVFIPFYLGVIVTDSNFNKTNFIFVLSLLFLFFGRIMLKDFRDRKGDHLYGKPTFLLKYGKSLTCLISFIAILTGNIILFSILNSEKIFLFFFELYFLAIYIMLYRLWKAKEHNKEQIAIGIGAKMGNGVLLTILGVFVLKEYNASIQDQLLFIIIITTIFLLNFIFLTIKPKYALIGYKG